MRRRRREAAARAAQPDAVLTARWSVKIRLSGVKWLLGSIAVPFVASRGKPLIIC